VAGSPISGRITLRFLALAGLGKLTCYRNSFPRTTFPPAEFTSVTIYNDAITMPRLRRPVAVLCIAVVALAAFLPGVSAADYAVFEPSFVLLPDLASVFVPEPPDRSSEQPRSLLALLPSRAPPA
jgi:hypothetical protein